MTLWMFWHDLILDLPLISVVWRRLTSAPAADPPPTKHKACCSLTSISRGYVRWKWGYLESYLDILDYSRRSVWICNEMVKGKSNKESCNNSHNCSLFSTPPLRAPLGILLWWTAVKIAVQQATAVVDFLFAPKAWAKIAKMQPPFWCIHSISMNSALRFSFQPMQCMTNTHIPVFSVTLRYMSSSGSSCSLWEAIQK